MAARLPLGHRRFETEPPHGAMGRVGKVSLGQEAVLVYLQQNVEGEPIDEERLSDMLCDVMAAVMVTVSFAS